jgi:3-phenylpropionate/trans-cinnamate dioxygenase ferredoxin reductase subunit
LREAGFEGPIRIASAENRLPYERPPLSKGFLAGAVGLDDLPLRPAAQYQGLDIELRLGTRVERLEEVPADLVLLATGARARRLPGLQGALTLRTLDDAMRLREVLETSPRLTIVGAGFIGCEVAAVARQRGLDVTVYERFAQPLERVLGAELGAYLASVHRGHGVHLHLGMDELPRLDGPVLIAVGSEPNLDLAAGLEVDAGVLVDEFGRTSRPGVFAAGDVARFFSPLYATHVRVEHFQTAWRHGAAVGRAMAGRLEPFAEAPWFWSDQYDLNLQYVGAGLPYDATVTRGRFGDPPFTVFYLKAGELVAAAGFNDHHTVSRTRHLLERGVRVEAEQLADSSVDLKRLARP